MAENGPPGEAPDQVRQIVERIGRRELKVGVLGLGYVGLPLALAFAEGGFRVLGFDVDSNKVAELNSGRSYIEHLEADRVAEAVAAGVLEATAELDRLGEPDALLICVPTPLTRYRDPDLRFVESTGREIARRLRRYQLVVLESTTYPGTTEELLRPILESGGLVCGRDFFLAFSPEREDPGNRDFGTTSIPKIVGGVDAAAGVLAESLYRQIVVDTVRVSSARAAEATKLTENIFRAVNIALVNELKVIYGAMGVDVWEVLDAASTKPFGFMRFNPGPGWGGHCIPVDPFYLSWKAREYGLRTRFIELAGEINLEMPRYVIGKLQTAFNERGKPVQGSAVLILGLAYKPDIADSRESPAFELIDSLLELGARVSYHDPHIPEAPRMRSWPQLPALRSVPLDDDVVSAQDAVVIVTNHAAIDYQRLLEQASLIVDTRGVFRSPDPRVIRA